MSAISEILCPECEKGHLRPQVADYVATLSDGVKITVPKVPLEVCDYCGEIAVSLEASRQIDAYIAEQIEQLAPRELERIREDLGVDQTQMSEILGLGGKTYHRWEKGNQAVSRSMGYYLRVLAEFPEAFDWLRQRGWRKRNRVSVTQTVFDFGAAFPHLARSRQPQPSHAHPRFNPAKALFGKAA
jgi:putative zinc finger/helix-turn-helix YgiT family protein